MGHWSGSVIEIDDWSGFASALPKELAMIGHRGLVAVRNFQLVTCEVDDEMVPVGQTDRLAHAQRFGTDRDKNSPFWNADGHDHDHDQSPTGKSPMDIIYAYVAEMWGNNYLVHYNPGQPEQMDLTTALTEMDAILIYDAAKLYRASKNEHWFIGDPLDALLLIFRLRGT